MNLHWNNLYKTYVEMPNYYSDHYQYFSYSFINNSIIMIIRISQFLYYTVGERQLLGQKNVLLQDIFKKLLIIRNWLLGYILSICTKNLIFDPFKYQFFAIFKVYCHKVYLEGTFWISWIFYKSAIFLLKLERKVSKCSYVQVKIGRIWIKKIWKIFFH